MGKKAAITHVTLIVLAIAILAMWGKIYPVLSIVAIGAIVFLGALRSIDRTIDKAFEKGHPELVWMDGMGIVAHKKLRW